MKLRLVVEVAVVAAEAAAVGVAVTELRSWEDFSRSLTGGAAAGTACAPPFSSHAPAGGVFRSPTDELHALLYRALKTKQKQKNKIKNRVTILKLGS